MIQRRPLLRIERVNVGSAHLVKILQHVDVVALDHLEDRRLQFCILHFKVKLLLRLQRFNSVKVPMLDLDSIRCIDHFEVDVLLLSEKVEHRVVAIDDGYVNHAVIGHGLLSLDGHRSA